MRPTRWSYSSLSTWKECPAKYRYSYIDALPEPPSAPMIRGTRLHSLAEDFMKDPVIPIPYDLKKIGRILDDLRNKTAIAEQTWLAGRNWNHIPAGGDGKAPPGTWVKAIVDVHWVEPHKRGDILHVHDYKSGREYPPSHRSQLELYSILGLIKYPSAQRAESSAIYIDGGYEGCEGSVIREMLPRLIEKWDADASSMESDNVFSPTPSSGACRFCHFHQSEGGPCTVGAPR